MGRVVAAYAYRDGRRMREIQPGESATWAHEHGDFVWIGFVEPNEQDLRTLQAQFGLHELAIEDALNAHQRPKVEVYGSSLFVVLRTATLAGSKIAFGETHIFVGEGYIITVRHGASHSFTPVRQRCEAAPNLLKLGVDYVLYAILDFVVDDYLPAIEATQNEVDTIEDRVLSQRLDPRDIERLYELRREVLRLRRVVAPMADVCARLQTLDMPFLDANVRPYFRDVHDHTLRVSEAMDVQRDVLTFAFEAAHLLESQRQSDISRRFAAWAAILAFPTALAGIYGMNFKDMPELDWQWGYFGVLGVIAAVCTTLYLRFRKAGWL
jgi:magnesium transporter